MLDFAIPIQDSDLQSYTKSKLLKAGYLDLDSVLDCAKCRKSDFMNIDTRKLVDDFVQNSKLKGFGEKSRKDLTQLFENIQTKALTYTFEAFFKEDNTLDEEDDEDEDGFEDELDLDSLLPTETLLINTLLVKGDVSPTPIEDILEDLEIEIYEDLDEEEIGPRRLSLLLAEKVLGSDWLADTPIYASPEACKTYPNIISALSRKAVLVLRGG